MSLYRRAVHFGKSRGDQHQVWPEYLLHRPQFLCNIPAQGRIQLLVDVAALFFKELSGFIRRFIGVHTAFRPAIRIHDQHFGTGVLTVMAMIETTVETSPFFANCTPESFAPVRSSAMIPICFITFHHTFYDSASAVFVSNECPFFSRRFTKNPTYRGSRMAVVTTDAATCTVAISVNAAAKHLPP